MLFGRLEHDACSLAESESHLFRCLIHDPYDPDKFRSFVNCSFESENYFHDLV